MGKISGNAKVGTHNLLLRHLRIDPQLKSDVFPRIRADKSSLLATKGYVICAFASRY